MKEIQPNHQDLSEDLPKDSPDVLAKEGPRKGHPVVLALAAIAALGSISLAIYQYQNTRLFAGWGNRPIRSRAPGARRSYAPNFVKTDAGRKMLWARGPHDLKKGEWFDITDSPLDPDGYQYGIGKDAIPAIDEPEFVEIQDAAQLRAHGLDDDTVILGYSRNGESKAYPVNIMNRHELVNDVVGGKPVTVGW